MKGTTQGMQTISRVTHPVVKRTMIGKFESATRMCDALERVAYGMRVVVHRVDAPLVASDRMCLCLNTVHRWIAHVHIRAFHVNLGSQYAFTIRKTT